MFVRKGTASRGNPPTESFVGQGTRIEGTVVVGGTLRVDGEVVGEIKAEGDVFIGETGQVDGDVTARNVVVGGRLTGHARAAERLELLTAGKIVGDAEMQTLVVEEGGVLEGHCRMREDSPSSTAPIHLDPAG